MLKDVLRAILFKFNHYSALANTPAAKFASAIDPRFRTDNISDAGIMRQFVSLSKFNTNSDVEHLVKMGL